VAHERTSLLLVRVWIEDCDPATVRARIVGHPDVRDPDPTVITVSGIGEIDEAVRHWLRQFIQAGDAGTDNEPSGRAE
jgi:hypothetical protein